MSSSAHFLERFLAFTATLLLCLCALSAADKPLDGVWWSQMSPAFKLGWVSGYAKAMDLAGSLQMATCAAELPMYQKQFPNLERTPFFIARDAVEMLLDKLLSPRQPVATSGLPVIRPKSDCSFSLRDAC
jgi:hypothetical protein